jgi:hypothetical protein
MRPICPIGRNRTGNKSSGVNSQGDTSFPPDPVFPISQRGSDEVDFGDSLFPSVEDNLIVPGKPRTLGDVQQFERRNSPPTSRRRISSSMYQKLSYIECDVQ